MKDQIEALHDLQQQDRRLVTIERKLSAIPHHSLALGLKSNRIFATRVRCSGKGKAKRTRLPGDRPVEWLPTPSGSREVSH